MNNIENGAVMLLIILIAAGCAHAPHPRGSVALKHSDREVDVCLGEKEVKPGDRVAVFRNECVKTDTSTGDRGGGRRSCTKVKVGEGAISQSIDDHYSTVKVDEWVVVQEGMIVEKL